MLSKKIILGSASPRRKELIEALGFQVEIRKEEVEESYPENLSTEQVPAFLAQLKAQPLLKSIQIDEVLITSDTVVIFENKILGKPKDRNEAIAMLRQLSGKMNEVVTAVYLYNPTFTSAFSVTTKVCFKPLSEKEITHYVDQFQPFDKAGAYGIQEWIGMVGVHKIEGDFYNVMGLPVNRLWEELNHLAES